MRLDLARSSSTLALLVLAAILLASVSAGCGRGGEARGDEARSSSDRSSSDRSSSDTEGASDSDENDDERLVPVEAVALERGPIEETLRFTTNLEAESSVEVFAQAARLVTDLRVEEGDRVRAGQVMLRLQDDEQRSALARAESQLAKAEREYQRQQRLFEQELIPEQTYNDATYELDQARLAVDDAERELGYTTVRAPIAGTITERLVNLGDNVSVGQRLFDLVDFDTLVARVFVPERELARLGPGQTARIRSESLGGEPRRGEVLRVAPSVDPRSGTVKVTVDLPDDEPGLRPGLYVEVDLVVDRDESALRVPKRALVYDDSRVHIYRLRDDMTVERLDLRPTLEDEEAVVPEGSSLDVGDRVIVAGQASLKDGMEVRLAETERDRIDARSTAEAGFG